jgi:hypothetical protein
MSISPRFTQQFPRWKTAKGLPGAFMQYSELFAEDSDGNSDEDEDTKKSNKSKYPWAILGSIPEEELPDGLEEYPSLPEVPTGSGVKWINDGRIVIRAFVKAIYRKSHLTLTRHSDEGIYQELTLGLHPPHGLRCLHQRVLTS